MKNSEMAFVIPAYNPDKNLLAITSEIRELCNNMIFIIDDGSHENYSDIFSQLHALKDEKIVVLKHAINLGKGAALKTVFNHILTEYSYIKGVVTLDSDGQHLAKDCLRVMDALSTRDNTFVLGYRQFNRTIPLKSYIGNNISRVLYKIILGKEFKDTQTGLRGLTKDFMKKCLTIKSNRFEFETEQLLLSVNQYNIVEIPIETVYIENNKASSFKPFLDSFRIYFVLFRYALSSIVTAIVDFVVFMLALSFGANIILANILARTVSIGVQFNLLDKFVFNTQTKWKNFILFVLYVYIMGIISAWLQMSMLHYFEISVVFGKIFVEGILFFLNFSFLRLYIFTQKHDNLTSL